MKTKIIYEDKELLVIYKPAGLAVQTAKIGQPDVVSELKNYLAGQSGIKNGPYLGVIHRLDQPVEGLLVFAKTKPAAAGLSARLSEGLLNKRYYAVTHDASAGSLVQGVGGMENHEQAEKIELTDYMYKDKDNRAVVVTEEKRKHPEAKRAVLQYQVLERLEGKAELLEVCLQTGRFHQIRAQLAHAGRAILGDSKYADERTRELGRQLGVSSVALCACSIEFLHPANGRKMCFQIVPEGRIFSDFQKFQDIRS